MSNPTARASRLSLALSDLRTFQIAVQSTLLAYSLGPLELELSWLDVVVILAAAVFTEAACARWVRSARRNLISPLISGMSLCLLLRSESTWVYALAAAVAIGSKYVLRAGRGHVFNPSAFAIALFSILDLAWVSPGRWGNEATALFALAGLGVLVVFRARQIDTAAAFLFGYVGLSLARFTWLGDPLAIAIHELSQGSLWLFAFYMITDPRTTPATRRGRIGFALAVAAAAFTARYVFYRGDEMIFALVVCQAIVALAGTAAASAGVSVRRDAPEGARVAP